MDRKSYIQGLAYGGAAYFMWGLLPLYWKLVSALSAYQIFAQRVVWSFLFVLILLQARKRLGAFIDKLRSGSVWLGGLAAAAFISINWLTYIWGVNNGYVVESSLGYYINPLVLTLFGRMIYGERMTRLQGMGILSALVGVVLSTWFYHRIPYVGLTLAFSFAIYGVLKKRSTLDSLQGLTLETLIVGAPALIYLVYGEWSGQGITGNLPAWFWVLIAFSGVVTSVPLLFYAEGVKRLPLNVLGFLQYISPTISLILGVTVFHESFDSGRLLSFGFIWLGLVLFSWSQVQLLSKSRQAAKAEA